MTVTLESQQLCDDWLKLVLADCQMSGADPVIMLKTYRAAGRCAAPSNDLLMATIDRALFELEQPVRVS